MKNQDLYIELLAHLTNEEINNICQNLKGRLEEHDGYSINLEDIVADQVLDHFSGWDSTAIKLAKQLIKRRSLELSELENSYITLEGDKVEGYQSNMYQNDKHIFGFENEDLEPVLEFINEQRAKFPFLTFKNELE